MYISLGVEFEFWVEDTEFVKGKENEVCDKLSRRSETDEGMGAMSATDLVRALGINPKFLAMGSREEPFWYRDDRTVQSIVTTRR